MASAVHLLLIHVHAEGEQNGEVQATGVPVYVCMYLYIKREREIAPGKPVAASNYSRSCTTHRNWVLVAFLFGGVFLSPVLLVPVEGDVRAPKRGSRRVSARELYWFRHIASVPVGLKGPTLSLFNRMASYRDTWPLFCFCGSGCCLRPPMETVSLPALHEKGIRWKLT